MKPWRVFLPRALGRAERSEARLNVRGGDLDFGALISFVGCFVVCVRSIAGSALGFLARREAEAFTVHLQDVDMMGKAIEQRASEPLRSEDRGPFIEWQVAGHQGIVTPR